MLPSSYVKIVDNNDESVVVENNKATPPHSSEYENQQQTTCLDEATCPFIQQRPHSALSAIATIDSHHQRRRLGSFNICKTTAVSGGSQSTLNTLCSYSRKQQQQQNQHLHQQQHNAVYNRLYHSDPSTNIHITDDSEHLSNYAHIKHSHRHPHYHLRRQSQPDEPLRLLSSSRNSSSVKSFTSQCYINPEYFYEIRPSRSCDGGGDDDSKASLIPRKPSQNQIMLLNSELHLLEGLHGEHSHSYPKINYLERRYLLDDEDDVDGGICNGIVHNGESYEYDDDDVVAREIECENEYSAIPLRSSIESEENGDEEMISSTETEPSDASEFHENKTSTLDRQKASKTFDGGASLTKSSTLKKKPPIPPPLFSETDSYSTVNDEITQLVSKHLSNSIKQLVARRFTAEFESYSLPLRRRHSCDSSELSDVVIPDLFNSPSRIKWNFLTGLPDRSRSQSQIYSSDYKTDEDEDDDGGEEEEEEEDDENNGVDADETEIDEIHRLKSSSLDYKYQQHLLYHHRHHMPIWRTSSHGTSSSNTTNTTGTLHRQYQHHQHQQQQQHRRKRHDENENDDCNAIMFQQHGNNELVENCCATHFMRTCDGCSSSHDNDIKYEDGGGSGEKDDDARVFEFELCTKENCEYLSKSQMMPTAMTMARGDDNGDNINGDGEQKNLLNNEKMPNIPSGGVGGNSNQKNINLKHNKFKKTKKTKKGAKIKENREQQENILLWNKIDLNHLMKKENCNINSVNLKPHSSSSSSSSVNHHGNHHRRNLKRHQKACDKLFTLSQRQQQSLNVTSLILATSSNSTQARIRNDGGIYFSNPDLSSIPPDLRNLNFINNSNNISSNNNNNNNSCQFINNDLRSNTTNANSNSNTVNSRSRFDSRFNNLNSNATNYLLESINSNNIDNSNNESFDELMQQHDLRRRLRYINLHGIIRRAQRRARKYLNSLTFVTRK